MDIQQINGRDPESVRVAFKNIDGGGSVTTGMGVTLVTSAASFDGVGCVKQLIAAQKTFYGISTQDVPINGFGKAVAYGYVASILISNVGTSITVTAGDILKPSTVAGTFFSAVTDAAMTTMMYRYTVAGSTNTISAQAWVSGYVRGL